MAPRTLQWGAGCLLSCDGRLDADSRQSRRERCQGRRWGVFGTNAGAFFLAEMGDKTQIATVALAAQYQSLVAVVAGRRWA